MASTLDSFPRRDATFRLKEGAVLVNDRYQRRVAILDTFSSQIWLRIDGLTSTRDIAADLARFGSQPSDLAAASTSAMIGVLASEGLIFLAAEPSPQPYHLAIPIDEQDPAETLASKRATDWVEHFRSDKE